MLELLAIAAVSGVMLIKKGVTPKKSPKALRIEKAYSAIGRKTKYAMGQGGKNPTDTVPTRTGGSDCSGFGAWLLGVQRYDGKRTPRDIETTQIYNDAMGKQVTFVRLNNPEPGAFFVYPDKNGEQGHMGLITKITPNGSMIGVDCGSGNYKRTGDAIQERSFGFMKAAGGIFVVPKSDYSNLVA